MGLSTVSNDEHYTFTYSGVKFHYRRMLGSNQAAIERRHTNRRGVRDERAISDAILAQHVFDWEPDPDPVDDGPGNALEYSRDNLLAFTDEVKADLIEKLYEGSPSTERVKKTPVLA